MNFDYNLLKVLAVILETRNTTTAAERLCTSQPAVSRSLRKIRDLFNDDILVRKGTNMELTPKAEEIKAQLSGIINDIDKLVNVSHSFDPATESSVLRVAIMVVNACTWMTFQSTRTRFTSSNIGMKKKITSRAYYSLFQLSQEFNCVPRTSTPF